MIEITINPSDPSCSKGFKCNCQSELAAFTEHHYFTVCSESVKDSTYFKSNNSENDREKQIFLLANLFLVDVFFVCVFLFIFWAMYIFFSHFFFMLISLLFFVHFILFVWIECLMSFLLVSNNQVLSIYTRVCYCYGHCTCFDYHQLSFIRARNLCQNK